MSALWIIRNIMTLMPLMHCTLGQAGTTTFLRFKTQNKNTRENNIYTAPRSEAYIGRRRAAACEKGARAAPPSLPLVAPYPIIIPLPPSFSLKISEQCKYRPRSMKSTWNTFQKVCQWTQHPAITDSRWEFNNQTINPLTPNDTYRGRTAPLTSKVAFYIFIQQI